MATKAAQNTKAAEVESKIPDMWHPKLLWIISHRG